MLRIPYIKERNIALDLGNNNTLFSDENDVLLSEPTFVALNVNTKDVEAIGNKAYLMFEKTHQNLETIKPLRGGVIADYNSAEKMIREMMKKVNIPGSLFNNYNYLISGVPFYTTEVEKRALRDALEQFNPRHRYLFYEPLAAAIGMDLDVSKPDGKLIVDIGGGITEIVVISLSGIVSFNSLRVAGDDMDEDIQEYFRKNYNFSIGIKTAEWIKIQIGSVVKNLSTLPASISVKGKNLVTGIPEIRNVNYEEIADILDKSMIQIENCIVQTLESSSPELVADIYDNGVYLTGGNSRIRGLKERLEAKLQIPVKLDPHPLTSVARGISKVLKEPKKYRYMFFE